MSNNLISNSVRFLLLLLLQIVIFNNINLFGFIISMPYILYLMLYPVNGNKKWLLVSAFLLGLILDIFSNTGGTHATACLILAYVRPSIFKISFGLSYEYQTIKINDSLTTERFTFIAISVLIHHLVVFSLEAFSFQFFWHIIYRTFLSGIFSITTCLLIIYLTKKNKR
jgi:rod shape-determining protein MreD